MKKNDYMFLALSTLGIFLITYVVLAVVGFVPEEFKFVKTRPISEPSQYQTHIDNTAPTPSEDSLDSNLIPTKIEIPSIGVSSIIQTPQSVDVSVLDSALTKGAVYYPGSGTLQNGNMFIFGHSTNWKVVNNQAYKTFNGLDTLKTGDQIELTSNNKKYIYSVLNVKLANEDDAFVNFNSDGRMLTISTCDTFGKKQDRWVVQAQFVETV